MKTFARIALNRWTALMVCIFAGTALQPALAATVTALDITGGSLQILNTTGSSALLTYALSPGTQGQLVSGTYQGPGQIVANISILDTQGVEVQELRPYTAPSGGLFLGPYVAPSGYTIDGNTLVMDIRAWFVDSATLGLSGSLTTINQGPKNLVFGTLNGNAFSLTWDAVTHMTVGSISGPTRWTLNGMIETSPIPLPPAAWLFGSGLTGLLGVAARRRNRRAMSPRFIWQKPEKKMNKKISLIYALVITDMRNRNSLERRQGGGAVPGQHGTDVRHSTHSRLIIYRPLH